MRPYQIAATEQILRRVMVSANYKKTGTTDAGGYIWHTTGSGKTLTSFKTAQLATGLETIEKVLFVVDRKDLDYQTMKEYDRFEKGAANGSKSTRQLEKNLKDPSARIIITTIQKLDVFVSRNKTGVCGSDNRTHGAFSARRANYWRGKTKGLYPLIWRDIAVEEYPYGV
jgi:type I restriction enzyme R subunit